MQRNAPFALPQKRFCQRHEASFWKGAIRIAWPQKQEGGLRMGKALACLFEIRKGGQPKKPVFGPSAKNAAPFLLSAKYWPQPPSARRFGCPRQLQPKQNIGGAAKAY
jgi:hypothetical protein